MPQPGLTYYINSKTGHLTSMIDNKESLIQAIYKALDTPKREHMIYDWLYGLDMEPFIGQDLDYVQTHIQKFIEDCLLMDDRITAIQNLSVALQDIDSCLTTFDVITVEGDSIGITKEINYGS